MRRSLITTVVASIVVAVLAITFVLPRRNDPAGTSSQEPGLPAAAVAAWLPPSTEGFAGDQACAECHSEIAETYAEHPMARSFRSTSSFDWSQFPMGESHRTIGGANVLEVRADNDGLTHCELLFDEKGDSISEAAHEMSYVVGSGQRALAFLERRDDALFMSPLNWYERSQTWGLAPNYRLNDPRRFDRRARGQCLACHTGLVRPFREEAGRSSSKPAHVAGIGCEKCHGPGETHIAFHQGNDLQDGESDPIVNPSRLTALQRESVCYQCHLQGVTRIIRPNRSDFDFRPGMSHEEIWTVLVSDSGIGADGRTRALSHVAQMRDSRCFEQSDNALGCISCHDPHRVPTDDERVGYYRSRCLTCHTEESCVEEPAQRSASQDSCIACHMPALDASNVSHVSQTDHRIVRRRRDSKVTGSEPSAVQPENTALRFFDAAEQQLPDWERARALGLGVWMHFRKSQIMPPLSLATELRKSLEVYPEDGDVLTTMGALHMEHGQLPQALEYYRAAVDLPDSREAALLGCLKSSYLQGHWKETQKFSDELIESNLVSSSVYAMRADAQWNLGMSEDAIGSALQSLALDPLQHLVREWLIDKLSQTGQADLARQQQRLLERIRLARPPEE